MSHQFRIAIAGAGISGLATLGYLVETLREMPSINVTIYLLQPPRQFETADLIKEQRDRLTHLQSIGIEPSQLFGGGQVYHPLQPSLFTFNGNSVVRGFNFVQQRYDTTDYFEWVQANRSLLAKLYPDFAVENGQQRHRHHTLDDIQGTTPRGAYGLYLHDQFLALKAHLPEHLRLEIIPEAMQTFSPSKQTVGIQTQSYSMRVHYLVQATGHRFAQLRPEWGDRIFNAYPCDRYTQALSDSAVIVGAGSAGIEVALHALHNLCVGQVTLVSRCAQARLPQVEPTEPYECQWFTREKMWSQPTAKQAQALLQQELEACYQACNLPYPGWDALLQIADYPAFLADYLQLTQVSPNHPLAHLVRPVMSFYNRVQDLLPATEHMKVLQLIDSVKPLFATQSQPCAELMLAAIRDNRLRIIDGEFLSDCETPTIVRADGSEWKPERIILATGFAQTAPISFSPRRPQSGHARCYQVTGTSLSSVHTRATSVVRAITQAVKHEINHPLSSPKAQPALRK